MREKIADWIPSPDEKQRNLIADEILTLISQEIEKVENPYKPEQYAKTESVEYYNYDARGHDSFEVCRQKILALLKEV